MRVFDIVVRNEMTGEVVTLAVEGSVPAEAQTAALVELFRSRGWRKASAFPPDDSRGPVLAHEPQSAASAG